MGNLARTELQQQLIRQSNGHSLQLDCNSCGNPPRQGKSLPLIPAQPTLHPTIQQGEKLPYFEPVITTTKPSAEVVPLLPKTEKQEPSSPMPIYGGLYRSPQEGEKPSEQKITATYSSKNMTEMPTLTPTESEIGKGRMASKAHVTQIKTWVQQLPAPLKQFLKENDIKVNAAYRATDIALSRSANGYYDAENNEITIPEKLTDPHSFKLLDNSERSPRLLDHEIGHALDDNYYGYQKKGWFGKLLSDIGVTNRRLSDERKVKSAYQTDLEPLLKRYPTEQSLAQTFGNLDRVSYTQVVAELSGAIAAGHTSDYQQLFYQHFPKTNAILRQRLDEKGLLPKATHTSPSETSVH